ncbi:MAG: hypothetical protein LJE65_17350 [Desulfobacteraceae bacterium]|nr:hypothetical protein [Desulfobacteraceae bacterium]
MIRDVLKALEAYMDAYIAGQDIRMDQEGLIDLADAIATDSDANRHMKLARRIFGAARGDRHYNNLLWHLYAVPGLFQRIQKARRPAPETDPTVTAFQHGARMPADFAHADDLAEVLTLLEGEVLAEGRPLYDDERKALRSRILALFDFQSKSDGMDRIPEWLRDKLRGLLIDAAPSPEAFKEALRRVGTVPSEEGNTTPEELIGAYERLSIYGGPLAVLPMTHGIRVRALQMLVDQGGRLSMKDGEPMLTFDNPGEI